MDNRQPETDFAYVVSTDSRCGRMESCLRKGIHSGAVRVRLSGAPRAYFLSESGFQLRARGDEGTPSNGYGSPFGIRILLIFERCDRQ